ncbi:radical SAM protein [Micromonospora sp. PPF5-17]|uniref:Radical SAM protein n=2 Tax=Micromonosporaceae TaxID=28056 RepID=A0ABX9WD90_9ACTN|nr:MULTISPECIES: intein-containing Rv2578c family radical SAM protein [Micromonospora]NES14175.1 radical SAM protein [Micromonospora sp. PPF5-17B]NES37999.1 radical SAM protein [Micromonospora solifontis]NES55876.1 radical SAM protein [Micromonospora sp. PPF5-6]RNL97754.1 radical SAM protein [Micromonospora solifontis]
MRWDNLSAPPDEGTPDGGAPAAPPLPLALPGAITRTFDTPGFAGMTFYEVQAKSIINRVPGQSRVPFEWTINPYRGCSHACVYCLAGDTPVLMADGRTRPISELTPGDRIYGTERSGAYRRYVVTTVRDVWSTVKRAYRVTLADGTTLVASGDHRFLTERGWKYVTGAMSGTGKRPYLTTRNRLIGTGRFATAPKESADYRRGYLCGVVRGDAQLGSRFRLTLADQEAVDRTQRFLAEAGVEIGRSAAPTGGRRRATTSPGTARQRDVAAIAELVRWPDEPTDDWRLGFLAGIFDAGGSCRRSIFRISGGSDEILDRTADALRHFGFSCVVEAPGRPNRVGQVRLTGGLPERLRFFHLTDPAVTRKRSIEGTALKCPARLGVVRIEDLGLELPLWDITTGTGDFIANGVVSHNCFARNTHTYLDLDAGADFDRKVIVKVNAGELVRRELAAPRWRGAHVAMGTNVDCYQRAEGRYRLMPPIIEALRDFANPFSILTKGTLLLRDLPLLRQAAEVTRVGLSYSVGFVDEALWRAVEPGTPSPRRRLDAVRQLTDAGFEVGVLMAPVLPGLSDDDESIEATVAAIASAGASSVTPLPLHLRPGAREWYAHWLARDFPQLVPRYRQLYRSGAYVPQAYQREVTARVRMAARRHGLHRGEVGDNRRQPAAPPPPPAEQLSLL